MTINKGLLTDVHVRNIELLKENPNRFWQDVDKIGSLAFKSCYNLEEITIPAKVKEIGFGAFRYCNNLKKVEFEGPIERLSIGIFEECVKLTDVILPEGLLIMEGEVFKNCKSLKEITIPKSVVSMSYGTFLGCDKLERVIFKGKNNLPEGLKSAFMGFDFDSFEINGDEVTFTRNIQSSKYNHERDIT